MQTIAFYRGRKYLKSWFFAWWCRSDFSHCETILSRQGGLHVVAGAKLLEGVRIASIELKPADWELWELDVDAALAHNWIMRHEGEWYDFLGLLGFIFRRIKGALRMWWCSEACAAMAGLPDPWRFDVATLRALCMAFGRRVELV